MPITSYFCLLKHLKSFPGCECPPPNYHSPFSSHCLLSLHGLQGALPGDQSSALLSLPIMYSENSSLKGKVSGASTYRSSHVREILSHGYEKGEGGFRDTNPTLSNNHLKSVWSAWWIELVLKQNTGMSVNEKVRRKSICTKIVF